MAARAYWPPKALNRLLETPWPVGVLPRAFFMHTDWPGLAADRLSPKMQSDCPSGRNRDAAPMDLFYTDVFVLPLPETHRFPMQKYRLLRERVAEAIAGTGHRMQVPPAATDEQILRAHDAGYLDRVVKGTLERSEILRIGFPWSVEMVERSRRSSGATIAACRSALRHGLGVNLAGGTHHAFADCGEGYCVFNDSAIAARALRAEGLVDRVLVIDCDVHQGNGTAAIAAGDRALFAFSIHGAKNFPYRKVAGDLDIALPDGTGDDEYLRALAEGLDAAIERSRPDLAIYLAGADPFVGDRLGRLNLSKAGLLERDRLVIERCRGARVPVAITMAGGYAPNVNDTVDIHFATVNLALELCPPSLASKTA